MSVELERLTVELARSRMDVLKALEPLNSFFERYGNETMSLQQTRFQAFPAGGGRPPKGRRRDAGNIFGDDGR